MSRFRRLVCGLFGHRDLYTVTYRSGLQDAHCRYCGYTHDTHAEVWRGSLDEKEGGTAE